MWLQLFTHGLMLRECELLNIGEGRAMFSYLALTAPLVIAFYTVLFGIDLLKIKNYGGFIAVVLLAGTIVGLPIYLLFFRS
jgi:hypothetical protein